MSYVDISLLDNAEIIGSIDRLTTDIVDRCQETTDRAIEIRCLKCKPSIGESDIPVDELTGYTTSPVLIQFGIDFLTYCLARSLRQAGSQNLENDVYDGIMKDYKEAYQDDEAFITYELVLNVDNEAVDDNAFIDFIPLGG